MKLKRNVESLLSSNVRTSTIAELNQLNRKPKIDLRGFCTSLFDMVLKEYQELECLGREQRKHAHERLSNRKNHPFDGIEKVEGVKKET